MSRYRRIIAFALGLTTVCGIAVFLPLPSSAACPLVTAAGGGNSLEEKVPATDARLNKPRGVAFGPGGELYIADTGNHRVRKVNGRGEIVTVAGNGMAGFSGDSGPAAAASLNQPMSIAFDRIGNLYIADSLNFRIRKVDPFGTITTVHKVTGLVPIPASDFAAAPNPILSVAVDPQGHILFVSKAEHKIMRIIDGPEGNNGQGLPPSYKIIAGGREPTGIAFDSQGNLYFADTLDHRVRMVWSRDQTITTVAGNGKAGMEGNCDWALDASLNAPEGVAVDKDGVYIADTGNHLIRKVDRNTGIISVVAGNGQNYFSQDGAPATATGLNGPTAMAFDLLGNLVIADTGSDRVRAVRCASPVPLPSPPKYEPRMPSASRISKAWGFLKNLFSPRTDVKRGATTAAQGVGTSRSVEAVVVPKQSDAGKARSVSKGREMGFFSPGEPGANQALSLSIVPESTVYPFRKDLLSGDDITFNATITNHSDEEVTVSASALANIQLTPESLAQNKRSNLPITIRERLSLIDPPVEFTASERLVTIPPGDKVEFSFYGVKRCHSIERVLSDQCPPEGGDQVTKIMPGCRIAEIARPGVYRLQFSYHYQGEDAGKPNVFRGELISPEVTIDAR